MSNPMFSVILPTHNGKDRIRKAIESVTTQSFTDYELIIICDACTDGTQEYVEELLNNQPGTIQILKTDFHRDGLARNAGLDVATGEWIMFLDDDDWFLSDDCFKQIAEKIEEEKECNAVFFSFLWQRKGIIKQTAEKCNSMAWCKALKREFIGDERFSDSAYGSDSEFFNRYIGNNPEVKACFMDYPIYYYNYFREGSLSWMLANGEISDIYRYEPLFSVIIPAHNEEQYIRKALDSVKEQTFTDYELIVVCDSCTDQTAEIAAEYGARIICVDYHKEGPTRNAGLDAANGKWILFLDADDWFLHEYAFQSLADNVGKYGEDVLDFSFIQKGEGYMMPSADVSFGMVWCRAWKRSFIGDHRFDEQTYGTDSNFYDELVKNNPSCQRAFFNMPIYYYNYMRKGSMSDMKINDVKVDLIITHWNEPWEVGKPLFDSIELQQCVRMGHVNIILVQDGKETTLPWKELLKPYSYNVSVVTMKEHRGASAARNVGIEHAVADWLMFMDFDDMLADIATLSQITRLFPVTSDVDIIGSKYVREVNDYGRFKDTTFNCEDKSDYRLIGKIFRREFLNEHNVRFNEECPEYSDIIFNTIAYSETFPHKVAQFTAPFYPFFKRFRKDGAFSTIETLNRRIDTLFDRDVLLAYEMMHRGNTPKQKMWMARVIADTYNSIRDSDLPPDERMGITDKLIDFWRENRKYYKFISPSDLEVALDESQTEAMTYIQEYYNYFDKEFYLQNDMVSFDNFMKMLDNQIAEDAPTASEQVVKEEQVSEPKIPPAPSEESDGSPRVVVYCGTKETYVNMIASAKSVLATTPVDKIYFLIEDDVFPYELPEIIETRNVSDIGIFDPNGPNFENVWTYMCLMRTAYPQMFPEYDKVLSLDIDVVVTENVSDLWDIDMTDYYYAGVPEEGRVKENDKDFYANFGVIMMNLKKLREDGMGDRLIEAVNTEHFGCPEQDAFNKYCKGKIYQLPNDYNVTVYSHITGEALRERILHYAGLKYWKHFGPVKRFYNLTWDQIMALQEATHG